MKLARGNPSRTVLVILATILGTILFGMSPASAATMTAGVTQTLLTRGLANTEPIILTFETQTQVLASNNPDIHILFPQASLGSSVNNCDGSLVSACSVFSVSAQATGSPYDLIPTSSLNVRPSSDSYVQFRVTNANGLWFTRTQITVTFAAGTVIPDSSIVGDTMPVQVQITDGSGTTIYDDVSLSIPLVSESTPSPSPSEPTPPQSGSTGELAKTGSPTVSWGVSGSILGMLVGAGCIWFSQVRSLRGRPRS